MRRIVLAYSGGFESSAAIPWLLQRSSRGAAASRDPVEVVAVLLDLGRGSELVEQRERALALGAIRCHVVDARDELAGRYILPALQAGAFASAESPLTKEIARPVVARTIVDIARMESAAAVAFGAGTGFQPLLDTLIASLNPALERIVPSRIWNMSEPAAIEYAHAHGIPPAIADGSRVQISANLWGRCAAFVPGSADGADVPQDIYVLTRAAAATPDLPACVELEFRSGVLSRVNGIEMPLIEMIESLEIIGGTHGVGRTDTLVEHADGSTSREIGEAPAASMLTLAHRELQTLVLDSEVTRRLDNAGRAYAGLIRSGRWFSPERTALDAFVSTVRPDLTGSIRLRLFKGECGAVPSLVNS